MSVVRPTSHFFVSQRLRLHYLDWGNEDAPPLIMLHGGLDHCRTWDWFVEALRHRYHIMTIDHRGHGDSQWVIGGLYELADHIHDLAQFIRQKELAPVTLIGHSMGGAVSLRYAGLYPDAVSKIIAIEGTGTWMQTAAEVHAIPVDVRMRALIDRIGDFSAKLPLRFASVEEACARMQKANPTIPPDRVRHLTHYGVNRNEDGSYSWKFDNYIPLKGGTHTDDADAIHLYRRIECPVLMFHGKQSFARNPATEGLTQHFRDARVVDLDNATHWLHHEQSDAIIAETKTFLGA